MPDVECVNVLKKVPELQCTPEVYEDCNAVEKKVPYLVLVSRLPLMSVKR